MVVERSMRHKKPADGPRWLLLIHQIPPKPNYFRAKVGRRLQRVGAVAIKNSVYALPLNEQSQEDLQWIVREITQEGGEATLCRASFIEGLRDEQIESFFQTARDADYAQVAEEARELGADIPKRLAPDDEHRRDWETALARFKKRLGEIQATDFFVAPGRLTAESAVANAEKRLLRHSTTQSEAVTPDVAEYRGRTWITRKNIHVDRIASAWLIRRFIDPKGTFKFVTGQGYRPKNGEVGFDMFEAEFTHEGDKCTFEVLVERFSIREPGIKILAEIIHDVDVKDGKFGRAEVPGIADMIAALGLAHRNDEPRLEAGMVLFDQLLDLYRRKRS
jgi:hypothetical protein